MKVFPSRNHEPAERPGCEHRAEKIWNKKGRPREPGCRERSGAHGSTAILSWWFCRAEESAPVRGNTPSKTHQIGIFCYFHVLSSPTSVQTSEGGSRGRCIGCNRTMHPHSMLTRRVRVIKWKRHPVVEEISESGSIVSFLFHFDMDGECGECEERMRDLMGTPPDQCLENLTVACTSRIHLSRTFLSVFIPLLARFPVRTEE